MQRDIVEECLRTEMTLKLGTKEGFALVIAIILVTDSLILLDAPVLRVVFGFLTFTILPGVLILYILKLNKIAIVEKIVLSLGFSVSFLIFFGFLIDQLYFALGYSTPLSTISLVVSFSVAMIVLCFIGYKTKTFEKSFIENWLLGVNLSRSEKAFLIVPTLFPALSIFGMYVMNTTDNNIILMFLLFLIPIYVAFVCFFNHKFPERLYPVVIFLISISLLLLMSLRSNYILGADVHTEYNYFQMIFNNLHWYIFGRSTLDACLVISLLPSIYQSFLNVNSEYLYKILYSLLFSIVPLIVFVISNKYVGEFYAFLASFFFMSQSLFIRAGVNPRTSLAVFFFALAIMVFLSDGIDPLKKRMLFIVFVASCVVSHYSTAYIFFFIMLFSWFAVEIFAKRFTIKKSISSTMVLLFFGIIFFWYSQVTEVAFNAGVNFVSQTFLNLHNFFIMESRGERAASVLGEGIVYKCIPHKIEFLFTWLSFVLIGVGVISMIIKYKDMIIIRGIKHLKTDFLKTKFSIEYLVLTVICAGLLVIMVSLPYISDAYDIKRLYTMMTVILSVVFILGGILLTKYLDQAFAVVRSKALTNFSFKKKALLKKQSLDKRDKNASHSRAYLIILLVLIPFFMCTTGTMYQIFGAPREIMLNTEGDHYDMYYIHDQESYGARWLGNNGELENTRIYTGRGLGGRLISQAGIRQYDAYRLFEEGRKIDGYIYLRYYNVVDGKILDAQREEHDMIEYKDKFEDKNRVYNNGGSDIWR